MVKYKVCFFTRSFITGIEKTSVILTNRQCCEWRNFQKKGISITNLTIKKLCKLDELKQQQGNECKIAVIEKKLVCINNIIESINHYNNQ